ncbi:hypothetical protein ABE67_14080 [Cytobacillus firmus]|uniref:replication-relaxation family protein n=1 Tax=Cytobacillus firmus TaxID=1399 RepID=UPI0018CD52D2|nr:replication-relaxation family protein [Cytobacillus firmus]MBG9450422.1 hypothetical protein [Cytobacillus firmus]
MRKRDLAIIYDLSRFRCITRDDIIVLHFKGLKQPVTCCNTVLKRLRRDGLIEVSKERQLYIYFPTPAGTKKESTKIPHFLKIVEFYKNLLPLEVPKTFIVELKYGKGYMEPDTFIFWKRAPFFVEIQRSIYSEKVMNEKIQRYESYYVSNEWQREHWQPANKKIFPSVILITNTRYKIKSPNVKLYQVPNISELVIKFPAEKKEKKNYNQEIKIKIG